MAAAARFGWAALGGAVVMMLVAAVGGGVWLAYGVDRPGEANGGDDDGQSLPWGAVALGDTRGDAPRLVDVLRSAAEQRQMAAGDAARPRTAAILSLSGGGSYGAFGAGFLAGWSDSGERPAFDIVAGVSAGALQAAFAFLGREADDRLREITTGLRTSDVYVERGALALALADARYSAAPLERTIERFFPNELIDRVAARHRAGARLLIGTVDMDRRRFVLWDLGGIAASTQAERYDRFRKVLLASAAVPIYLPPVYFAVADEGSERYQMHADGGLFAQTFLREVLIAYQEGLAAAGLDRGDVQTQLYVIQNEQLSPPPRRSVVPAWTVRIGQATIDGLYHVAVEAGLYRTYTAARQLGQPLHLACIPADYALDFHFLEFPAEKLDALYRFGKRQGQRADRWLDRPPDLERLPSAGSGAAVGVELGGEQNTATARIAEGSPRGRD